MAKLSKALVAAFLNSNARASTDNIYETTSCVDTATNVSKLLHSVIHFLPLLASGGIFFPYKLLVEFNLETSTHLQS